MGMYTEILIKADIRSDIKTKDKEVLNYLFGDGDEPDVLPSHEFFECPRWEQVGNSSSYYHIPKVLNYFGEEYLFSRSDLKSYNDEAEKFFDWLISSCVDAEKGECVGYHWYEESDKPTLALA